MWVHRGRQRPTRRQPQRRLPLTMPYREATTLTAVDPSPAAPQPHPDDVGADFAAARVKIENLEIALKSCRTIGMATGVLVERYKVTPEVAFQTLTSVSQRTHRKIRDIAAELIFTGLLPGH